MRSAIRRGGKFVVVWIVVSLVVLDSAWACRWRRRMHAQCGPGGCDSCEMACGGVAGEYSGEDKWHSPSMTPAVTSPSEVPAAPTPPPDPMPLAPMQRPSPMRALAPAPDVEPPVPTPSTTPASAPATAPDTAPAAAPAASPATTTPTAPAPSPIEDDPFAPAPAPNPPATRPVPPAARPVAPPGPAPEDNDPFAPQPARPAASSLPPAANPAADPTADPFKISANAEQPIREWIDDTGMFRVRGRLIAIQGGKVRILKVTGRTTTVPLTRLSRADRSYVAQMASEQGSSVAARAAR